MTSALSPTLTPLDEENLELAMAQAKKSFSEGGIPIGAVLYHHATGKVIAQGHNQRAQKSSLILHGEMDCLESLGRIPDLIKVLSDCTMYSTLSPCIMCTSTILMYGIPRVVFAENKNFVGGESLFLSPPSTPLSTAYAKPRILINACSKQAEEMMGDWIKSEAGAKLWWEDIGLVGEI
ncbi:cytosine deaminase [Tulasnella sp. JGI-2019a]|nr:cytosine deaminase [Tulasnella sp. JGI-2019a]